MYREHKDPEDAFLTRVVVDTCLRKFYLYSSAGEKREVDCDDIDQFMNVLDVVRKLVNEDCVFYAEPLTNS